jgi:hypothetical protein
MIDLDTLRSFEGEVRKVIPGFEIRYKDQSFIQKVIGFLMYPWNREYMTRYTTTLAPFIYFPSKEAYESLPRSSLSLVAHEMVHMFDTSKHPIWFRLSYALPQAASLLPLALYAALAGHKAWIVALPLLGYIIGCALAKKSIALFWCVLAASVVAASVCAVLMTGWAAAALFAGLAMFAPWPSPWRASWEHRGYAMTVAVMAWTFGLVPELVKQNVLRQFTTSAYFFMSWDQASTYAKIDEAVKAAQSGSLQKEFPYSVVHAFLDERGLLKK